MRLGDSFTDSVNIIYDNLGRRTGLQTIEYQYIKDIKSQVHTFFQKFAMQYFRSFRWGIPVLIALLLFSIHESFKSFPISEINFIATATTIFYNLWSFRKWSTIRGDQSFYGEKQNLKAFCIQNRYVPLVQVLPILTLISQAKNSVLMYFCTLTVYLVIHFSTSFLIHAKSKWLDKVGVA